MTYEIQIRHSRPIPTGEGFEHLLECLQMEGRSEEDVYRHIRLSCNDHIACISSWHHQGVDPYSVDTGELEFFTDVLRPARAIALDEARMG